MQYTGPGTACHDLFGTMHGVCGGLSLVVILLIRIVIMLPIKDQRYSRYESVHEHACRSTMQSCRTSYNAIFSLVMLYNARNAPGGV